LRRACGARLRGYLGGLFRLGAALRAARVARPARAATFRPRDRLIVSLYGRCESTVCSAGTRKHLAGACGRHPPVRDCGWPSGSASCRGSNNRSI
jgi:hypothetical protein